MNPLAWWRRADGTSRVALAFLALELAAAVLAPLGLVSPTAIAPDEALQPPSGAHWFGTDQLGRDILSRVVHGGRTSMTIAAGSVGIAALTGVTLGLLAGYRRGRLDEVVMRGTDVILAFPGILLALVIVAVLDSGAASLIVAVGISGMPQFARVTRAATLSVARSQYVEAAHLGGCGSTWIVTRHVLPNVLAPVIALVTIAAGTALLVAASLSFLGLGPQPPAPEWGAMLNAGRDHMRGAPWLMVAPGLAITATVLAVSVLGDGLRDALDPQWMP